MLEEKKYLNLLHCNSVETLQKIIGLEIVKSLSLEWQEQSLNDRGQLIKMIDALYGNSIFLPNDENKVFIHAILQGMSVSYPEKLEKFRETYCNNIPSRNPSILNNLTNCYFENSNFRKELLIFLEVKQPEKNEEKEFNNICSALGNQFYDLLDYQYYVKQRVLKFLNSKNTLERVFVHMPTGTGKTKTTMHTIVNYIDFNLKKKGLILWIAQSEELLQQALDTFQEVWKHLGDGDINVFRVWKDNNDLNIDISLNGIAFCSIQKLMSIQSRKAELFECIRQNCRLIVVDEAHRALAKESRKTIECLMNSRNGAPDRSLVGLSATPGRSADFMQENIDLANMFGNHLISIDENALNIMNLGEHAALNTEATDNVIRYFQNRGILAEMKHELLDYDQDFTEQELSLLSRTAGDDYSSDQLKIFALNKKRNNVILKKLIQLNSEKIPTIVFACSVQHARILSACLKMEGVRNGLVLGGGYMSSSERTENIKAYKDRNDDLNMLINYQVLTTGFDAKNTKCVFMARPTKSIVLYSQIIGRGLRGPMMGGNSVCTFIDIRDNLNTFNNEQAFSYFNDYWR